MTMQKKLGIWMDHANAHLMEFTAAGAEEKVSDAALTQQAKEQTVGSSENVIHNKEQQQGETLMFFVKIIKQQNASHCKHKSGEKKCSKVSQLIA